MSDKFLPAFPAVPPAAFKLTTRTIPLDSADFCLLPLGLAESSVAKYIAECQRVLDRSGLTYNMHGYGTNLEGAHLIAVQLYP